MPELNKERETLTQTVTSYASLKRDAHINDRAKWLLLYFFFNLTLTLYNKAVLSLWHFNFPWTLTGIHTLCSSLGCYSLTYFGVFTPAKLVKKDQYVILLFSFLYTLNIAISNVSLNLVTVPVKNEFSKMKILVVYLIFHQVVRATTPVFTVFISKLFFNSSYSFAMYMTLIPVILGVVLTTFGDYHATSAGFLLTMLGTFLASLKTVITNVLQVGKLHLHPMDLLLRMSPLAFIQTMGYAALSGEFSQVLQFKELTSPAMMMTLLVNGSLAFFLNYVSFTANKKTSPLTMTVAGLKWRYVLFWNGEFEANVKQILSVLIAMMIFSLPITFLNGVGIVVTIVGGMMYSMVEYQEKYSKVLIFRENVTIESDDKV